MQSHTLKVACAVAALTIGTCSLGHAQSSSAGVSTRQAERAWHSASLRSETVVGPNGAVTTGTALLANDKWGIGDRKHVEQITDGVYTLRGGPYRNPSVFIEDARWIESKNAEILLDTHGPTLKGQDAVRDAVQRAVDQVQLIHDQTLRLISHGLDGRQAAEQVYMPRHLRGDWENYGQMESHVRQVYNGTLDGIRRFLGTPTAQALTAASVDENLQFVRYLVDPRKAEGLRQAFTLAFEGDPRIRRLELRNGVLVITDAGVPAPTHLQLTRQELAAFVLGTRPPSAADALSQLDRALDRGHLMPPGAVESVLKGMKAAGDFEH